MRYLSLADINALAYNGYNVWGIVTLGVVRSNGTNEMPAILIRRCDDIEFVPCVVYLGGSCAENVEVVVENQKHYLPYDTLVIV